MPSPCGRTPSARRACAFSFGNMKRPVIAVASVIGAVLVISFMVLSAMRDAPPDNWLQLSGPVVSAGTSGVDDQEAAMVFTLSNAGPREVRFHVDGLEWMAKHSDTRGAWDGSPLPLTLLPQGGTAELTTRGVGTVPPPSEIGAWWSIHWSEEPSAMRRFLEQVEARLPFALWPRRPLARGTLTGFSQDLGQEDYMRLRYGLTSAPVWRISKPFAEPTAPGNDAPSGSLGPPWE